MFANPLKPESTALRIGRWLNVGLRKFGAQLQQHYPPGHHMRPIGRLSSFLEDVKARGFECRNVLDVGASDGSWSRELLRVYPGAAGILVEPRAECRPALRRFCAEHPAWSHVQAALGDREEERPLAMWGTASTLLPDNVARADDAMTVEVKRCDSLFSSGASYPQLLKLDVEGFELEVLAGAERLLGHVELLIVEASLFPFGAERPLFHDIVEFLKRQDYLLYDVAGFIRRPHDAAIGLLDLAFARRDGELRAASGEWH